MFNKPKRSDPLKLVTCLVCLSVIVFLLSVYWTLNDAGVGMALYRNQGECVCQNDGDLSTAIIYLQKPWHRFHGNHWFHIGEYYLSKHRNFTKILAHKNYRNLKIITHDTHLSGMMTKFTFFLIVLSTSMNNQPLNVAYNNMTIYDFANSLYSYSPIDIEVYSPLVKSKLKELKRFNYCRNTNNSNHSFSGIFELNVSDSCGELPRKFPRFAFKSTSGPRFTYIKTRNHSTTITKKQITTSSSSSAPCHCGDYLGSVGDRPINTTEWFNRPGEATTLRIISARLCETFSADNAQSKYVHTHYLGRQVGGGGGVSNYSTEMNANTHKISRKTYSLVIYQRDKNRRFSDLPTLIQSLSSDMHSQSGGMHVRWKVSVVDHSEEMEPCLLHNLLSSADVFLTTHGFQCTALMFMPPSAHLIEIFPYKYYKSTYVSLATQFNLHYHALVSLQASSVSSGLWLENVSIEQCMRDIKCRSYARQQSVVLTDQHIEEILDVMRAVEKRW